MADLVTRLLLNNSQFDNSIRESTQLIQQFLQMGRNITSTISKFAGVLGVAVSASEVFTTAMNSNRTSLIEWQATIDGAKASVDQFFTAVSTGDWSVFSKGILEAIGLTKEYRRLMLLANQAAKIGKTKAERFEAEKNNYEWGITSENTTLEEKKDYHKKYISAAKQEKLAREETNTFLMASLMKGLKANNITTIKDARLFRDAYETYLNPATKEYLALEKYKVKKEYYDEKIGNADAVRTSEGATWEAKQKAFKKYLLLREEFSTINNEKYNDMIKFQNFMTEQNSEEVMELLDLVNENLDKLGTLEKDMDAADADLLKATEEAKTKKETSTKTTETVSKTKAENVTVNTQQIESSEYFSIPMVIVPDSLNELEAEKAGIIRQMNSANSPEDYIRLKVRLDAKEEQITNWKSGKSGMQIKGLDVKDAKPLLFDKSNVKTALDYADSLNAVASAMGTISSMTNEGATAWLTWTANLMTSIATAIPAIQALTTAKTAEAGANAIASATLTPVVGWLLAGAAAASVIAAMATMPKFTNGGIVEGNSTVGDMNIVRVNSGEMVLNNTQQRNLFRQLNSSTKANETNSTANRTVYSVLNNTTHLSTVDTSNNVFNNSFQQKLYNLLDNASSGSTSGGKVEFKITGKQLVGVLDNYNKQKSRI